MIALLIDQLLAGPMIYSRCVLAVFLSCLDCLFDCQICTFCLRIKSCNILRATINDSSLGFLLYLICMSAYKRLLLYLAHTQQNFSHFKQAGMASHVGRHAKRIELRKMSGALGKVHLLSLLDLPPANEAPVLVHPATQRNLLLLLCADWRCQPQLCQISLHLHQDHMHFQHSA